MKKISIILLQAFLLLPAVMPVSGKGISSEEAAGQDREALSEKIMIFRYWRATCLTVHPMTG